MLVFAVVVSYDANNERYHECIILRLYNPFFLALQVPGIRDTHEEKSKPTLLRDSVAFVQTTTSPPCYQTLPSSMAAIDTKIGTGHVTTRIAQKKDCRATILTRLIEAAEHALGGPLLSAIGVVIEQVSKHLCKGVSRREGIDTNSVLAPFHGKVMGELYNGSLGGIVNAARCVSSWRISV